ncbi:MAG: hypothetical protein ACRCX2_11250, partial [Paraclostridium sp.]
MRIKKIIWKDFTKNPIFTKDDMWVQGDLNTNILELEVDSNFIGKEVQLITGKIGSIDAVVYRQVISELNTFMIENTAVKSGNFNIFLRILDGDNLLVSEALKYEVKQGVCFSRISIPQKDEDWIEHVLADLKETTEKAVVANSDLENTIIDSVKKNELLKVTIEKAEATDKKLETNIVDSIEKNLELKNTIADSVIKKEELETSISGSAEKKSELDSTVASAIEENSDLNKTISDSVIKKEALETSVADSVNKKLLLDGSIQAADEKVVELEIVAKDKLEDINETSDSRLEEINKVADDRIEEVKVSGGAVNKLDNRTFEFWLGTTADYEKIVEKSKGVLYQHFDEDGNFAGGYYKRLLTPVTRGLIEWFDFADGKGTETTLKSRVSDNVLTLTNFNFDENSGWTGKGLKFDGVDDFAFIQNLKSVKTVIFNLKKVASQKSYVFDNRTDRDAYLLWWNNNVVERKGLSKFKTLGGDGSFVGGERSSVFVEFTSSVEFIKISPSNDNSAFFKGDIFSIILYDVILTEEELQQIYECEQS